jgi:hypothetical protein
VEAIVARLSDSNLLQKLLYQRILQYFCLELLSVVDSFDNITFVIVQKSAFVHNPSFPFSSQQKSPNSDGFGSKTISLRSNPEGKEGGTTKRGGRLSPYVQGSGVQ